MDASRLLAVVNDVDEELRGGSLDALATLNQHYTAARDAPTTDNTAAIQEAYSALVSYATEGIFSEYPPSKLAILESIQATQVVGPGFQARLGEILSVPGQTTAGIVTKLTELQSDLKTFQKACNQTKSGLQALRVEAHSLPQGEFEAGILIPRSSWTPNWGPSQTNLSNGTRSYEHIRKWQASPNEKSSSQAS